MVITPKLLTSECSAHYPRLWNLMESLSHTQNTRPYPIMLDMISFVQEFEDWITVQTDHIGNVLQIAPPTHAANITYGASPIVSMRLDFFAEYIGSFIAKQEDIGKQMIYDLGDWHHAILLRTAPADLPEYKSRKKCPECTKPSIMKCGSEYVCVNKDCLFSWKDKRG